MHLTLHTVIPSVLWSGIAGSFTWLVLLPVRRRWLAGLLLSVVLTGSAASLGALISATHSMLLPMSDLLTLGVLSLTAGLVATFAAATAARRFSQDNQTLRAAIIGFGQGDVPKVAGRRLSVELEQLRNQLRATARSLSETRERERSSESTRSDLISWMSHDLRTPLAGLRAISEALEDGVSTEPERYYKQFSLAVERLSRMVDELFDLSRIQAGAFSKDPESLSLSDLVSDCVAELTPLARAKAIELNGSGGDGAQIAGNGSELNRALTNLIANAIRHTPEDGRVDVTVSVLPTKRVEVIIGDQCGGIAEHDLPQVFDLAFRGGQSRNLLDEDARSAGLGLAITRGIIEAHAGTVDVENIAEGCRFRVLLPVLT